jgi:hypothetical protein
MDDDIITQEYRRSVMKTLKEFRVQINEVLKASDPIEKWIDDFVHSKNPKFAGKSTKERIEMAKGAYYAKQKNESAAISQNSTEITDMNEDHLVHVSDGSKYDEVPHPKDIEHVKTGAMHHGGKFDNYSDKGAFFKFKSKEDAQHFVSHVNKCPHRTCSADLTEAVEYKGIGTDVVDKKKVLNPPIPLTQKKKEVKDFKEEVKSIDKGEYDYEGQMSRTQLQTTMRNCQDLIGMIKNDDNMPEWVQSKITLAQDYISSVRDYLQSKEELDEGVELIAKHEVKADAPHKSGGHVILTKSSNKWHVLHNKKSSPEAKDLHRSKLLHSYNDEKEARAKFKELKEEQINEISKKTLGSYINKAEKEADRYQQNYTKLRDVRDKTHGRFSDDTPELKHLDRKAVNRDNGVYTAKQKLAKEEVQIDELSKDTLHSYAHKALDNVTSHMKASNKLGKQARDLFGKGKDTERNAVLDKEFGHRKAVAKRNYSISLAQRKLSKEEVQIDEVSKSTLMRYIPAATRAAAQHTYSGKEAQAWAGHHMRAGDYAASDRQLATSKSELGKSLKRIKGVDTATKKLGTKKTYEQFTGQIDELNKSTLQSYRDKAGKDVDRAYDIHQNPYKKTDKDDMRKLSNRVKGDERAEIALNKEEVQIDEATVSSRKYDWGTMKTVNHGKSFSIPLHPEHHEPIAKLKHGESHSFKDETGRKWKATREHDTVHFHGGSYGTQKTSVPHSSLTESRGHKVLATFFKNREVAQRAFTGQNDKEKQPTYNEKGIETPGDKKKVNEAAPGVSAKAPSVATAKKTKSTAKEYASASIPGTKRVTRAIPDNNEVGGAEGNQIKEDQYASDYKIKYYVDPITGENKTRKIRPHRVDFKNSKMRGEPAQADSGGDYGA